MRKMKDSGIEWIGEIPEHWNCSKAKYYIQISNGSDPKTDGDIPVYGSGSGCFKTCGESKDGPAVLLGRKGTVDIPRYIEEKYWNVDTAFDVKTDETSLLLKYYFYLSTCFDYRFYTATTTLPSMTQTSYENMFIPVPNIDMQHKIVAYIESKCKELDMIITAKEKTNELLKERRQSIIYEAVTKGLDPTVPMKDSGIEWIGEIPEGWDTIRVKHLATEKDSLFLDGDWINSDVITDEGIRYLTSGNVGEGFYKEQGKGYISEETFKKLNCLAAYPGDLMISRLNEPVGRCCIIPDGEDYFVVAVDNVILRPNQNFCKKYLLYCMNTDGYANAALMAASGTTMQRISRTALGNLTVPVTSYAEQVAIAEYLDERCAEIDAIILANNTSIEKLKEYRQSVIYEAVTGKVEI